MIKIISPFKAFILIFVILRWAAPPFGYRVLSGLYKKEFRQTLCYRVPSGLEKKLQKALKERNITAMGERPTQNIHNLWERSLCNNKEKRIVLAGKLP